MDLHVSDAPTGRLVDGRYRVEATLARGGMATVYRALDTRLDRVVALKVMHPELAVDEEFVARFIGEARSAARLSHHAVVAVFDQGEDDGAVFLAMEYVEGRTLRQVLRDRGRLSAEHALEVIEPVLAALDAAHTAGIVHRDVKPENVLVGDGGRIKVADFGLARALTDASTTTRGLLLGTVNYISPEQALGEPATPRSDVYSTGVMLYELLTGAPPHTGATDFVVVRSHIEDDVPAPSDSDPGVPAVVDELVRRATTREPADRFADAGDFLSAVRAARAELDAAATGLESRDSAGVSIAEAMAATSGQALARNPEHTAVISRTGVIASTVTGAPAPIRRAPARRASPQSGRRQAKPRSRWRGPILFTLVMLLAVGTAVGAWWYGAGRYTVTPSLLNITVAEAQAKAQAEGLGTVQAGEQFSEVVQAGLVVETDPGPGERILHDGEIELVISKGPERYEVPDLAGKTRAQAEETLTAAGIPVGEVTESYHDEVPVDVVISQSIAPGEKVRRDTAVALTISLGREPVQIEDFTNRPFADAEQALSEAGFKVVKQDVLNLTIPAGTVIAQNPASGTAFRGDTITLQVSWNPFSAQVPVPDVIGMDVDQARAQLESQGFRVDVRGERQGGREVTDQNPKGGEMRPPGSLVRLSVASDSGD